MNKKTLKTLLFWAGEIIGAASLFVLGWLFLLIGHGLGL